MDVIHSAIWVSDMDQTLEFYVDALGLEQTNEFVSGDGARNVYVAGESDTEIQFKRDPDREVDVDANGPYDHVAIAVNDTDAEVERFVEETEATLSRGPLDFEGANARVHSSRTRTDTASNSSWPVCSASRPGAGSSPSRSSSRRSSR